MEYIKVAYPKNCEKALGFKSGHIIPKIRNKYKIKFQIINNQLKNLNKCCKSLLRRILIKISKLKMIHKYKMIRKRMKNKLIN